MNKGVNIFEEMNLGEPDGAIMHDRDWANIFKELSSIDDNGYEVEHSKTDISDVGNDICQRIGSLTQTIDIATESHITMASTIDHWKQAAEDLSGMLDHLLYMIGGHIILLDYEKNKNVECDTWCYDNFGSEAFSSSYSYNGKIAYVFINEEDATAFKLKWV